MADGAPAIATTAPAAMSSTPSFKGAGRPRASSMAPSQRTPSAAPESTTQRIAPGPLNSAGRSAGLAHSALMITSAAAPTATPPRRGTGSEWIFRSPGGSTTPSARARRRTDGARAAESAAAPRKASAG